jgi:hypothetical protein
MLIYYKLYEYTFLIHAIETQHQTILHCNTIITLTSKSKLHPKQYEIMLLNVECI